MQIVIRDNKRGESLTIDAAKVLGREGDNNDIPVADPTVSGGAAYA